MAFNWKKFRLSRLFGFRGSRKKEELVPPSRKEVGKDHKIVNGGIHDSSSVHEPGDYIALFGIVDGRYRVSYQGLSEITDLFIQNIQNINPNYTIDASHIEKGLARVYNWTVGASDRAYPRPTHAEMKHALEATIDELTRKYGIPVIDMDTYDAQHDITQDRELVQGDRDLFIKDDGTFKLGND